MKYQVQFRRLDTPQARWRPINDINNPFDTIESAQIWIDINGKPSPWEYHIVPVPE